MICGSVIVITYCYAGTNRNKHSTVINPSSRLILYPRQGRMRHLAGTMRAFVSVLFVRKCEGVEFFNIGTTTHTRTHIIYRQIDMDNSFLIKYNTEWHTQYGRKCARIGASITDNDYSGTTKENK